MSSKNKLRVIDPCAKDAVWYLRHCGCVIRHAGKAGERTYIVETPTGDEWDVVDNDDEKMLVDEDSNEHEIPVEKSAWDALAGLFDRPAEMEW